jgi:hypothetical protein
MKGFKRMRKSCMCNKPLWLSQATIQATLIL